MKNKIFITLGLISSFFFISCNQNQKIETKYYDTGEVHRTAKRINEYESEVRYYFKNGQIELEEIVNDSSGEGRLKKYYKDGVLAGDIIFSKNKFVRENIRYPIRLDFKDNPAEFKVGNTYQLRVLGVSLCSTEISKKLEGKQIPPNDENSGLYLYEITPKVSGNYTITVIIDYLRDESEYDSIFFPIKVIE